MTRYRIELEVVGGGDPDMRLKLALKSLWRRWRLRCRSIALVRPDGEVLEIHTAEESQ